MYLSALPCGSRDPREAYHEVDTFDDVNFAIIRPVWSFAPKRWPNLRHNSVINFLWKRHNSIRAGRYRTSVGKMRQVYNPEATNAVEVLRCDSNLLSYFKFGVVRTEAATTSDKYRIPFLIEWYIGDIINFNDCTILLVDINQVLLESRNAVHPHDIAYRGER
jgi:hypothetical protein